MRRRTSPSLLAVAALGVALVLAGCGNKESTIRFGETEGIYLDVGELKYQVEISRQLNPTIPEDRTFLTDVSPASAKLGPEEVWFAVFVRVENESDKAQPPATDFTITDTEGHEYRPVSIGPANPFRYSTEPVPSKGVAPDADSAAGENTSIAGMELLFRLKRETLDNRPLELTIQSAGGADKATDVLDV